jgi:hypothetical protein
MVSGAVAAVLWISLALVMTVTVQTVRFGTTGYSLAVVRALIGVVVSNITPLNWIVLGLSTVGIATLGAVA